MADRAVNLETVIGMVNTYFRNVLNLNPDLLIDGIVSLPTVDAAPVRHGRWEMMSCHDVNQREMRYRCSRCHHDTITHGSAPWERYCPMCGAKLDGKDGDNG